MAQNCALPPLKFKQEKNRNMKKNNLAEFTAFLLGICVFLFAAVKDYNYHTNFSRYHTHSWIKVQAGNQLCQA